MPIYEYVCTACSRPFSKFFKSQSAAAVLTACPHCGATDTRRTISAFQVHQTLKTKIEQLDPRYEKELDWADRHHKRDDPMNRINLNFDTPND